MQSNVSKKLAASSFRTEDGVKRFLRNVDRSHMVRENLQDCNGQLITMLAKIYLLDKNEINWHIFKRFYFQSAGSVIRCSKTINIKQTMLRPLAWDTL